MYIAFACETDADCGDWRHNQQNKDMFNEELLGVFFSLTKANKCAKEHGKDISQDYEDDEEDSDEDEDAGGSRWRRRWQLFRMGQ